MSLHTGRRRISWYSGMVRTTWDLYRSRVRKRAAKISAETTHATHKLFRLLPSGGATECSLLKPAATERVFSPQAVSLKWFSLHMCALSGLISWISSLINGVGTINCVVQEVDRHS
ncbi:hypothetical protein CHARACLAT_022409 [Characodon lateralis]|uniref:Uncharacterized protein n=1 Tax=Characodon lateralis TaxID=208331 RepID=A0ABU7DKZ4_9TELE|nr:hypothetical protein [Characodon lateralis]